MKNVSLVALNLIRFNERKRFKEIYNAFLEGNDIENFLSKSELDFAIEEIKKADKLGAKIVTLESSEYPKSLKSIQDPPLVLYIKGSVTNLDNLSVSIVGSRKCTSYGRSVAYNFAKKISSFGITIVSGLAVGIDSASHIGSLDGKGNTFAVIGSGLDWIYPASNKALAEKITLSGAIISEFPFGTRPEKYNFPFRNRIISGISPATVVVEAAKKSGSLITARIAAEQGKDVFAVPGNITSRMSEGTNALLKDGAIPITDVDDLLSYVKEFKNIFSIGRKEDNLLKGLSDNEIKILSIIENGAETVETISERSEINVASLISTLTYMEVKGIVKRNGGRYIKAI